MSRRLPVHPSSSPGRSVVAAALAGLPWCCIGPAVVSLLGFGSGVLALSRSLPLTLALLLLSAGFLGRANYLVWVRRHGARWARITTIVSTIFAVLLWAYRLPWLVRAWVSI